MDDKILIAIVAASSAVLGTIAAQIGTLLLAVFAKRHERKASLCKRYEELAGHVNDSLEWANSLLASLEAGRKIPIELALPVSVRKAYSLCLIYFPLLKPSVHGMAYCGSPSICA